jgi:molecular chaperone HscA
MALLQITEPGQSAAPQARKLAAGIDLGTTNSLVASVRSGQPGTIPDVDGEHLLPSAVRYLPHGVVVGRAAKEAVVSDPLNTITSAKRLIGRGVDEVKALGSRAHYEFVNCAGPVPRIRTVAGEVSPIEVSSEVLKTLAGRAEAALGGKLAGVVITVPAYFDDAQRQATKDAATLAGLNVFRLLNEPTAAAVAYGLDRAEDGLHAIYDLGGGTFDISVLRLDKGVFEVLATGGDSALGGDDFDYAIAEWIMRQAGIEQDADLSLLRQLLREACAAKEALSVADSALLSIELAAGVQWQGELTRTQLDALIEPLVRKTISACRRTLRDAGISAEQIQEVVMVGGSTRVAHVREAVGDLFACQPLVDIDPDKVVAIGAAIQADVLAGNKPEDEMLLLDVIPLSLGVETMGGLVEKIIPRNTTIPVAKAQDFTTFKDGQTAMAIHVLQGERDLVNDCRSLARFELRGIPPMVAGAARIRVTFRVDADGLLGVEAEEQSQNVKASITVKPSYGLTDKEVADMLQASIDHASADLAARKLSEARVAAKRSIEAIDAALASDGDELLTGDERARIEATIAELGEAVSGDVADAIDAAAKALERTCEFYVERRMNEGIRRVMAGHTVKEFE